MKRLAIVAAVSGAAVVIYRKFFGSKDADWQAARPSTPYAPPPRPEPVATDAAATAGATAAEDTAPDGEAAPAEEIATAYEGGGEAGDDPQAGETAHLASYQANDENVPGQPAEGGVAEAEAYEPAQFAADVPDASTQDTLVSGPPSRWTGEGIYVGTEPPEGFSIKGNERSMKYHVPDSPAYARTVAEVWFNSEEAAQAAGFIRAQR